VYEIHMLESTAKALTKCQVVTQTKRTDCVKCRDGRDT